MLFKNSNTCYEIKIYKVAAQVNTQPRNVFKNRSVHRKVMRNKCYDR